MMTGSTAQLTALMKFTDQVSGPMGAVMKSFDGLHKAALTPVKALGGLAGGLGDVAKIAGGAALGGALFNLPGQLLSMAQGAAADEQAMARLAQSIRNLGGDFDAIMGQVNEAIAAGQKLAFTDDEVRDSFQFLAAATGDADEALRRQKAAMDLARGANIPLAMATKMLGKLNEENIEVFKKLGITLGDTATEADALAAVQAKFGGQAEAFANSTAGQFEQAKIAISEIQESIGSALLPVLAKVGGVLSANLPAIQAWVGAFAGGVANVIGPALEALAPLVQDVFGRIVEFATPIMAVLPDIGTAIGQAFRFFTTGGGDIEVFRGVLNRLLGEEGAQGVIHAFTNLTGFIHHDLVPAFQTAASIVSKVLSGDLSGALAQVGEIVKAVAPRIGAALLDWGQQFVTWVGVMWPPFQAELLRLGQQVLDWVRTEGPEISAVLLEWGQEFIAWVGPMIPPFLAELGLFGLRVAGWLGEKALEFGLKFWTEWVPAFVGWIISVWPDAEKKFNQFKDDLAHWIVDVAAPEIGKKAWEIGDAIVRGIWTGQDRLRDWLTEKVSGLLAGLLAAAKSQIKGFSPSRVWEEEIGIPIVEGIVAGILGGQTDLVDAVEEVTVPLRQVSELIDNELAPAFDLMMDAGTAALETLAPESGGMVATYQRLGQAVGVRLVDAFHALGLEAEDVFDKARDSALQLMQYLDEILSQLSRIEVPGAPGGGGSGSGGDQGPVWGLFPDPGAPGSPTNPGEEAASGRAVMVYQTINVMGTAAPADVARAATEGTLAALARQRLVSGVVG